MQAAAMDDADAPMPAVTAVLDEPPHARAGLSSGHPMQIATVAKDVRAALQPSNLTTVDARRGVVLIRSVTVVGGRRQGWGVTDGGSSPEPAARNRPKSEHVDQRALARVSVLRVV